MLLHRRLAGLVVVDHRRAVLGDIDAVGARGEAESRWRDRARRRPRSECASTPRPPRRLGRREPAGEAPEMRAAKTPRPTASRRAWRNARRRCGSARLRYRREARRGMRGRNSCKARCMIWPRKAASGSAPSCFHRSRASRCRWRRSRKDWRSTARCGSRSICFGRASDRRSRLGRPARVRMTARGRARAPMGPKAARARSSASRPAALTKASSRCSQRDGTVGTPSTLQRAGEIDLAGAERLGEIVGGKADAALRRAEPERLAHRPAEPRARLLRPRPHAFVEAAQDHQIGLLQPRFERAPDEQARMERRARPHHLAGDAGSGRTADSRRRSSARPWPASISSASSTERASPASPCHRPDDEPPCIARQGLGHGGMGLGQARRGAASACRQRGRAARTPLRDPPPGRAPLRAPQALERERPRLSSLRAASSAARAPASPCPT